MNRSFASLFCFLAALFMLGALAAAPAQAQHDGDMQARHHGPARTVTVSGEGTARATPDEATVRFGVVTEGQTAEGVREENARAARNVLNAARELVDEENIRLETLRLQPRYDYDRDEGERRLVGYEAQRTAVVEIDDLEVLPVLVARVVERGANRLEGISYDLSDRAPVRREALREAAQDARDKARVLAQSLGVTLGEVVQISEQGYDFPQPRYRVSADMERAQAAQSAPEPDAYAPGEIEVTVNVQVAFALE
jgi:uncharacterized protein YggE